MPSHPAQRDCQTLEDGMLNDDLQPISILVYEDLAAMHDWLARVFGLVPGRRPRSRGSMDTRALRR
jgi:hypothetical protein